MVKFQTKRAPADLSGGILPLWKQPLVQRWWPLLPILLLALATRLPYLQTVGFAADFRTLSDFMNTAYFHGTFRFYDFYPADRVYPPITIACLSLIVHLFAASRVVLTSFNVPIIHRYFDAPYQILGDPQLLALTKLTPLASELACIGIAYALLRRRTRLRWVVPVLLAVAPGLIANTLWWGQFDALVTLFIVVALLALQSKRPGVAWTMLALALLTKQQAVLLAPLLLVLTVRRYSLRKTAMCVALCAAIGVIGLLPFVAGSGLRFALRPYTQSGDPLSNISNSALNLWYAIPAIKNATVSNDLSQLGAIDDSTRIIGNISYREVGWGLLGLYVLLVLTVAWRQPDRHDEFLWAGAIFLAAFLFPTQIHERYLYIPLILLTFSIAQHRRLVWISLGISYTFAYNMFQVADLVPWVGRGVLWPTNINLPVALLNLGMLVEMQPEVLGESRTIRQSWEKLSNSLGRSVLIVGRAVIVLALVAVLVVNGLALWVNAHTALWLSDHVADFSALTISRDSREVASLAADFGQASTWRWDVQSGPSQPAVNSLLQQGVHYLVVDSTNAPHTQFDGYVQSLVNQGATVLYRSDPINGLPDLVPRQAILWTFRPQHETNVVMDDSLRLIGYNIVGDRPGSVGLLFHWYTQKSPPVSYQLFLHLVAANTNQLLAQADGTLGSSAHPSNSWRPHEIVFETVYVPLTAVPKGMTSCAIQFGLYQLSTGQRAAIKDNDGQPRGDSISLEIPCS